MTFSWMAAIIWDTLTSYSSLNEHDKVYGYIFNASYTFFSGRDWCYHRTEE